jgi:multidrug resistance efflux pump
MRGQELDEAGELAGAIRAQRLERSRKAVIAARGQLQKLADFLPEGLEAKLTADDLTLKQMDEQLARFEERLTQMAAG